VFPGSSTALPGVRLFPAPIQWLFTGEDGLRVLVANVVAGLTLRVAARFLNDDASSPQVLEYDLRPLSSGIMEFHNIPLPRGVLLNVVILALGQVAIRGECFVRVDVIRGRGAMGTFGTMLSGYVGTWGGLAWPGNPLQSSIEGPGWHHTIINAAPAVGVGHGFNMATRSARRILSARTTLTTSAVAGARRPYLTMFVNGSVVHLSMTGTSQDAGVTKGYTWAEGVGWGLDAAALAGMGVLPVGTRLDSSDTDVAQIAVTADGLLAGDQFGALNVYVEEWRNPIDILAAP